MNPRMLVRALRGVLLLVGLALGGALWAADAAVAALQAKAENGNAIAQYNLGLMYVDGQGVARDPIEAYVWLSLAAENGATGRALRNLSDTLTAEQLARAKARLAERRASIPSVVTLRPAAAVAALPPAPTVTPAALTAMPVSPPPVPVPAPGLAEAPAPTSSAATAPPAAGLEEQVAALQGDKVRLGDALAAAAKDLGDARAATAAAEQRAKQAEASAGQHTKELILLQTEREQLRQSLAAAQGANATSRGATRSSRRTRRR